MTADNRSIEIKIRQVSAYAEELRTTLKISFETDVKVSLFENQSWHGEVFPSILAIQGKGMALTHSYHAESLDALLDKMIEGTKEELDLAKEGKGWSIS